MNDETQKKLFAYVQENAPFDLSANAGMAIPALLELLEMVAPTAMPGAVRILGAEPSQPAKTGYHCPILGQDLQVTCQAKSCRFWVDYVGADNCIQAFMHKHQQDQLSLTEISYLTRINLAAISRIQGSALQQLRQKSVGGIFAFSDLEADFILRPNAHVCVACEALVDTPVLKSKDGFVWCSQDCLMERPEVDVHVEHKYGVLAKRLLKFLTYKVTGSVADQAVYETTTIQVIAQALGYTVTVVEEMLRRHKLKVEAQKPEAKAARMLTANGDRRVMRRVAKLGELHESRLNELHRQSGYGALDIAQLEKTTEQMMADLQLD